jgi:hypothetical protein
MRERNHLEVPDVEGRIILKWIFRKLDGGGGMDWIELAQDRYRWWIIVYAIMNLQFP